MQIRKGFYASAVIATVVVAGLAYMMMGGDGKGAIRTSQLTALRNVSKKIAGEVQEAMGRVQKSTNKKAEELSPEDVIADPALVKYGFTKDDAAEVSRYMNARNDEVQDVDYNGYHLADFNDKTDETLDYAMVNTDQATQATSPFISVRDVFAGKSYVVAKIHFVGDYPMPTTPDPTQKTPPPPVMQHVDRYQWIGPILDAELQKELDQAKQGFQSGKTKVQVIEEGSSVVNVYTNKATHKLLLAMSGGPARPEQLRGNAKVPSQYLRMNEKTAEDLYKKDPQKFQVRQATDTVDLAMVDSKVVEWWKFWLALTFGIGMAFAIEMLTDYYVSTHKRPVREVAGVSSAGAAPMIISGFAYAAESSVFMVFSIVVALLMPMILFPPAIYGSWILSFYGIALVGLGLLTTTGFVLAMDTFGPISDNAQGVYEMSGEGHDNEYGSKAVQRLDAAGNTTKALTKGFAIATAVVAAVALFHSFLEDARLQSVGLRLDIPEIFLGLMIGGAAPYLFSSSTIKAVGRAAFDLINEVRRQFREDAGIMAGTSKPDYARCVSIVTAAAQRELMGPAILAIALPMAVAFGFAIGKPTTQIGDHTYNLYGAQALGGFLAGAILSGQLMAVLLANSGGMWDNAKKLIEDGLYGGKGTDAHKAAVVCDTVGDPFKDTAGPALNPLIKVMNLVALLLAPVVIQPFPAATLIGITLACVVSLAFSIWWSGRTSMSDSMTGGAASAAEHASMTAAAAEKIAKAAEPAAESKKKLHIDDEPEEK
ncbi:MAG: sodium/proton-translocating pyrophosphatase [Armatimonadetes bacterium]|nr:sodium/proton-translocating pyrophosphatase [Armatimonadota bacterium]